MRYYKRNYEEIIQRFNKDWSAIDWYYFEVGEDNYAPKQIQITYENKVFKYDETNIEDDNGGLAEGALKIEEYTPIEKDEFFALRGKEFTNTYLVSNSTLMSIGNLLGTILVTTKQSKIYTIKI
jgi:hypothetical protein